jgi:hypothetical protein
MGGANRHPHTYPRPPGGRTSARHGYMLHANPACVRVGAWVHPTGQQNRRPGFSPPPSLSTGSCRQPHHPGPDSRPLLQRQRGLVLFCPHLAGHFLLDPISLGLSMPNRCRVSESTRLPEPGLECSWPAPGNGGALPVRTDTGIPRRRIGRSFDLSRPIIVGVLWCGGRCRLSFFLIFLSPPGGV